MIRGKFGLDTMDFDDLYNNLRVYEQEVNGQTGSKTHGIAFLSTESKGSTSRQSTARPTRSTETPQNTCPTKTTTYAPLSISAEDMMCSFFAQQASLPTTYDEDLL